MKMDWLIYIAIGFFGGIPIGCVIGEKRAAKEYEEVIKRKDKTINKLEEDNETKDNYIKAIKGYTIYTLEKENKNERNLGTRAAEASEKYHDPDFDEHFEEIIGPEDDEVVEEEEDDDSEDPTKYILSDKVAQEEFDFTNKSTLRYYQMDDILVDEDDTVIKADEMENLIGWEAIEKLPETEKDVMYVRNEDLDIDYEIIIDHDCLYRDVFIDIS